MMPADPRAFLRTLFDVAVARAHPSRNVAMHLPPPPKGRTVVLGAGKASGAMASAVEAAWPRDAQLAGLVITRYGHVPPSFDRASARIEIVEASHPVPDAVGTEAAERMLAIAHTLTADDLALCLVSGGGSALSSIPATGMSLEEKQRVHRALLECGAAIDEMNCVRKHLSAIKGGRLALACAPARVVTLLISDVPGDSPSVIASGPTVADETTCEDALRILARYGVPIAGRAREGLVTGSYETPKPSDPRLAANEIVIVATPRHALEAAAEHARAQGIRAYVLGDDLEGESRDVGEVHAAIARSVARHGTPFERPCVILSGGETTVTIARREDGTVARGGRATEFLLACAIALRGEPNVYVLAADTDGIDGVMDNAGAFVTPDTLTRADQLGLRPREMLDRNDAYDFFSSLGDLVVTGPTFTNVNDFRAVLIV